MKQSPNPQPQPLDHHTPFKARGFIGFKEQADNWGLHNQNRVLGCLGGGSYGTMHVSDDSKERGIWILPLGLQVYK